VGAASTNPAVAKSFIDFPVFGPPTLRRHIPSNPRVPKTFVVIAPETHAENSGSLYPALYRMERHGWLEAAEG